MIQHPQQTATVGCNDQGWSAARRVDLLISRGRGCGHRFGELHTVLGQQRGDDDQFLRRPILTEVHHVVLFDHGVAHLKGDGGRARFGLVGGASGPSHQCRAGFDRVGERAGLDSGHLHARVHVWNQLGAWCDRVAHQGELASLRSRRVDEVGVHLGPNRGGRGGWAGCGGRCGRTRVV